MRSALTRLHKNMTEAHQFLAFAQGMDTFRAEGGFPASPNGTGANGLARFVASTIWKRQAYAFSVVGIYGAHERFLRDVAEEAAGVLAEAYSHYEDLPAEVRKSHLRLSLSFAKEFVDRNADKVSDIELTAVLTGLSSCLAGSSQLNRQLFGTSTANFRSSVIRQVLARIGLRLPDQSDDPTITHLLNTELSGLYATAEAVIDDLADRRNEVAHGSDYDILDLSTLSGLLRAVYAFDCWVHRRIGQHLLARLVEDQGTVVGSVAQTYTNSLTGKKTIGSMTTISTRISRGRTVYIRTSTMRPATVLSIEKDRAPLDIADGATGGPFGFDFGWPIAKGCQVYVLPDKHAALAGRLIEASDAQPQAFAPPAYTTVTGAA